MVPFLELFWMLFFLIPFASAEQIPDYNNPYSPILTDQEVYSWTDKIHITIIAPSWNANRNIHDDIGADPGHFIKISTRDSFLEPYRLTETNINNGIFTGEVILTGFLYDVDGDGTFDTVPKTSGNGPTNGFLETKHDSAITISFEFADRVIVTHSVMVSWNIGTIRFLEDGNTSGDNITVQIVDADMNLNPESIDSVTFGVYSDSDVAGLDIVAIETHEDSGMFEANILFSSVNESSGNRLFSKPGDQIFAIYEDRTLPSPHNIDDELEIIAQTSFISDTMYTNRATINSVQFSDGLGNNIELTSNQQIQIVASITNNQDFIQPFTYFVQVKNNDGILEQLSWFSGTLQPNDTLSASQSWIPANPGAYTVESFMWESIPSMNPLSVSTSTDVIVK